MKRIFLFFTKFSKLRRIVESLYKGFTVASDVLELVNRELDQFKPESSSIKTIARLQRFFEKAAKAVGRVVKWLGGSTRTLDVEARAEVDGDDGVKLLALENITDSLDREAATED